MKNQPFNVTSRGNGKRDRAPLLKRYRIKKLLILGEARFQQLTALIKEPVRKIKSIPRRKKYQDFKSPSVQQTPDNLQLLNPANLNTETKVKSVPCWPQDDEHLFGDLSVEEQQMLTKLLKGGF